MYGSGKTRIGVKEPLVGGPHNDAMLSVDGKILAREIYVNIHNSVWPDYVFRKDYKLPPLNQVAEEIAEQEHLPGVPSAKEIESSGISLGEMNRLGFEKIEQIFLYLIEQNKKIEKLEAQVKELIKK